LPTLRGTHINSRILIQRRVMIDTHRSLATVLFTDIVASTERATELGDRRWRAVLQRHHALVRRELTRFGGREIATAGDGFLAVFDDPERAIRCGTAIRDAVRELGLEVRSGVHSGELEHAGRSVSGIAVHIGSRVIASANAGEVIVSGTVRDLVEGSGFEFDDRGLHTLKGVRGEWRLYAVTAVPVADHASRTARLMPTVRAGKPILIGAAAFMALFALAGLYVGLRETSNRSEPLADDGPGMAGPGIAVLPFAVDDVALAAWSEGLVGLLTTNLDGAGGLRAIDSRTVLARWRETNEGPPSDLAGMVGVARRTGARYALVGNVVSIGPAIRLAANVYEVGSGRHLGGMQEEGQADSVYTLVDRLSRDVLATILPKERRELRRLNLAQVTTRSLPALKAYIDGETLLQRSDFAGAITAYRRALDVDSTFALAWYHLGLAASWNTLEPYKDYFQLALRFSDRLPPRAALMARALASHDGREQIRLLREAARRFPDDPEAWYFLGDVSYHVGPQVLTGIEESRRAFSRAIALDPAFSPAYIHLFEILLFEADTAQASALVNAFKRFAPESEWHTGFPLAFSLAFGDSAARTQALQSLDGVSSEALSQAGTALVHPRYFESQEAVFSALAKRQENAADAVWGLLVGKLQVGKVKAALHHARDSRAYDFFPALAVHSMHHLGLAVPRERLEQELILGAADTGLDLRTFHVGLYEADLGRWDRARRLEDWARTRNESSSAAGDSLGARTAAMMAEIFRGYSLWKRGQLAEALSVLVDVQQEYVTVQNPDVAMHWHLRWFIGDLLLEAGNARDAAPYFASFYDFSPAWERLGRIYEEIGRFQEAREAYLAFADAWQSADPELRPRVEAAQRAVQRLTSVIRE
jgi:class 3 adenylate cyclase/tetratricopeptide (TPR) repeat protein